MAAGVEKETLDAPICIPIAGWEDAALSDCLGAAAACLERDYGIVFLPETADEPGRMSDDRFSSICHVLAGYVAAVTLRRWAVRADVDMEPELVELIDEAERSIEELAPLLHATPFLTVDSDEVTRAPLSEYLGRTAQMEALSSSMLDCSPGNDIIWMAGEKAPDSRPSFKTGAFFELERGVFWHFKNMLDSEQNRGVAISFSACRPFSATSLSQTSMCAKTLEQAMENRPCPMGLPELSSLAGIEGGYVLCTSEYLFEMDSPWDESRGAVAMKTLSTLGLMPADARVCCLIESYGYGNALDVANVLARSLGWPLLYSEDARMRENLESAYTEKDFTAGAPERVGWMTGGQFLGSWKHEYSQSMLAKAAARKMIERVETACAIAARKYLSASLPLCWDSEYDFEAIRKIASVLLSGFPSDIEPYWEMPRFDYPHFADAYIEYLEAIEDARNSTGRYAGADWDDKRWLAYHNDDIDDYPVYPVSREEDVYSEKVVSFFKDLTSYWMWVLEHASNAGSDKELAELREGFSAWADGGYDDDGEAFFPQDVLGRLCSLLEELHHDWAFDSAMEALASGVSLEHLVVRAGIDTKAIA